jgi:non-homologous end joining protein Ku
MKHIVNEGDKVSAVLRKMFGEGLSINAKSGMYKGIVAPTLLYGSEVRMTDEHCRKETNGSN